MGLSYILWVNDDAVRCFRDEPEKYRGALGEAILTVCKSAQWSSDVPTSAAVLNYHNCVNRAGEQHSDWQAVYLWAGNCLWSAHDLSDQGLRRARELIDEEIERRKTSNSPKTT